MNNPPFHKTHVPPVIDRITTRKIFQACRKISILLICSPPFNFIRKISLKTFFFFLLLLPYLDVVEHDHETHQAIVDYNTYMLSYDIIYKKLNIIEYHLYLNYESLQFKLFRLPWI